MVFLFLSHAEPETFQFLVVVQTASKLAVNISRPLLQDATPSQDFGHEHRLSSLIVIFVLLLLVPRFLETAGEQCRSTLARAGVRSCRRAVPRQTRLPHNAHPHGSLPPRRRI